MRRIAVLVNSSIASRLFSKTPFFELLKKDCNNYVKIYTTSGKLSAKIRAANIKVFSARRWFFLKKLGLKREELIPLIYKFKGIFNSDLILFSEWVSPELFAILKEAKRRKIPTLFAQEGSINPTVSYSVDIYPDRLAVWGEVAKNLYVEKGIQESRITITGQPRFDWYYRFKPEAAINNNPKKILFASQALWAEPELYPGAEEVIKETIGIIHKAAKELGVKLYCKLHPSDKREFYDIKGIEILPDTGVSQERRSKWFSATGYDPDISDLKNLVGMISSFDVVVTILSTLGLEAMILNKPTIFLDLGRYYSTLKLNIELKKEANFAFVHNEPDFRRLLALYLQNPTAHSVQAKEVLYNFIYKNDGKASERLIKLINEMV